MEAVLDTREILCVERGEDTFDEALLNGHEIRKASGAGIVQTQALPVPQGMIAGTGPVVEARLAADGANDQIGQFAMNACVLSTKAGRGLPPV